MIVNVKIVVANTTVVQNVKNVLMMFAKLVSASIVRIKYEI